MHITGAPRGGLYTCPLCGSKMIARHGEHKQAHFAHEEFTNCPPDDVARAAAARWIAQRVDALLRARQSLVITWPCPMCKQPHTADLLDGVRQVREGYADNDLRPDVALLDGDGALRAVIVVRPQTSEALMAYARRSITVVAIGLASIRDRMHDLPALLQGAAIYSTLCVTQQQAARAGIITDIPTLIQRLTEAANTPPYYVYGPLETQGGLTHVLTLGSRKLWLPPILWQRAIGGMLHSIAPTLQIISQEWPQPDGAVIALYYVTVKDTYAVAVRRFAPGQPVVARLGTAVFRTVRVTATEVARCFAEP